MANPQDSLTGEKEAFLAEEAHPDSHSTPRLRPQSNSHSRSSLAFYTSLTLNAILLLALLSTRPFRSSSCAPGPTLIPSPARPYVAYKTWKMDNDLDEHNAYKADPITHEPTHSQTEAWRSLLAQQNVLASPADLSAIGALRSTSSALADGSGYLTVLDAFHQLHCINYVREFAWRDFYTSSENSSMRAKHFDHCIDTLRQVTMCHADVGLIPFDWIPDYPFPFPDFRVTRECRDWEGILEFSRRNQPVLGEGSMVHPDLGPVPARGGHAG